MLRLDWRIFSTFLGCFVLAGAGCKKTTSGTGTPPDACALITRAEVEAIQGSPIQEMKSSATSGRGFLVSQCFYTATEYSKSVSLSVTRRDPSASASRSVHDSWKEMFERHEEGEHEERGEREEEEHSAAPTKVDGIGEEAYWTGMRFGGALYVLKHDAFIRISVGGGNEEADKVNKSKALAMKAIPRL